MARLGALGLLVTLASLLGVAPSVRLAATEDEAQQSDWTSQGFQASHPSLNLLPFENIDVASGNVSLSFTDVDLPGNGLLDLQVKRSYNAKDDAWHIGPGFIRHPDLWADELPMDPEHSPFPVIVSDDGGEHPTGGIEKDEHGMKTVVFQTREFWRYDRRTHRLEYPNGIWFQYDLDDVPCGCRRPTDAWDPFDNHLHYDYEYVNNVNTETWHGWRIRKITQYLGPNTREVSFNYENNENDHVHTITYRDWTWTYTWTNERLSTVTLPTGAQWTFGPDEDGDGVQLTTPGRGAIRYHFNWWSYPRSDDVGGTWQTRVVTKRETLNPSGTVSGLWTIQYDPVDPADDEHASRTVSGPDNMKIAFRKISRQTGTLGERETYSGETSLEKETNEYQSELYLGWDMIPPPTHPPYGNHWSPSYSPQLALLSWRTIQRGTSYYHITNLYHEWSTYYADYGQPYLTYEEGDFTRATRRTFKHDFADHYIRGKIKSEQISDSQDPNGTWFTKSAEYDSNGFVTSSTVFGATTTYAPDTNGNVGTKTDPDGHQTTYTYSWGALEKTHTPEYWIERDIRHDGTPTAECRYPYQPQPINAYGPELPIATYDHDALGRLTTTQPPVGAATVTVYDEWDATRGLMRTTTTRDTSVTKQWVDGFGRVVEMQDSEGVTTKVAYDAWGRKAGETLPFESGTASEPWSSFAYDALGRLTQKTNPDNTHVEYGYNGLNVEITDENGHIVSQKWQAGGDPGMARLAEVDEHSGTNGEVKSTIYSYDVLDTLTGVQQEDGATRQWSYNSSTHRLDWESHPESGRVDYEYSLGGMLAKKTDADGRVIRYDYDRSDRLTGVRQVDARDTTLRQTTIGYDAWGHRGTVANEDIRTELDYGSADSGGVRLLRRTDTVVANGLRFVTTYDDFDDRDNVRQMTYPSGRRVGYDYDTQNRPTTVCAPNPAPGARGCSSALSMYASEIRYDAAGGVHTITHGNGAGEQIDYDERSRPQHIVVGSLFNLTYTYDGVGNVKTITESSRTGHPESTAQAFDYDAVDRLKVATGAWGRLEYTYDSFGNRKSEQRGTDVTNYSYPTANRLQQTTGRDTWSFGYYSNGNLSSDPWVSQYTYTPTDLVETATPAAGGIETYKYDGDDQRIIKISGSLRTTYTARGAGGIVLSEFEETGGQLLWMKDYMYAGSRVLAAVRTLPRHTLTVTKQGDGGGTVTVASGEIDCGMRCAARYVAGSAVTLTAVNEWGSRLTGWAGGCSGSTLTGTATVTIGDADTQCTATFTIAPANNWNNFDADGAGKPDIFWHNVATGENAIWTMDGTVRTGSPAVAPMPDVNWRVVGTGDFDGDGYADVVWRNVVTGENRVWYLNGTGYKGQADINAVPDPTWRIVAVADFNGDGYADLLWRNAATGQNVVWIMQGVTYARYEYVRNAPETDWEIVGAADFDGDRKPDILWRNRVTGDNIIWLMDGVTFIRYVPILSEPDLNWRIAATGDFNGDQHTDILWRNVATGDNLVWFMDGTTKVSHIGVVAQPDNNWVIGTGVLPLPPSTFPKQLPANGATAVQAPVQFRWAAGTGVTYEVCWDTNTSGDCSPWRSTGTTASIDVLPAQLPAGTYRWQVRAQNAGGRTEADSGTWWPFTAQPPRINTTDFTGDGKADIFWHHLTTGANRVWAMNGTVFVGSTEVLPTTDGDWRAVGTGDFDGDNQPDILWRNYTTGDNRLWHMNGTARRDEVPVNSVSDLTWRIVAVGDFNADGKADIVWRNAVTGENVFWLMNDATYVTYVRFLNVSDTTWEIVGAADYSGDGQTDLVWHNTISGQNIIWVMNGTTYGYYTLFASEPDTTWMPVGRGDYTGDGWTDLLWRKADTGSLRIWAMVGPAKADQIEVVQTEPSLDWVIGPGPFEVPEAPMGSQRLRPRGDGDRNRDPGTGTATDREKPTGQQVAGGPPGVMYPSPAIPFPPGAATGASTGTAQSPTFVRPEVSPRLVQAQRQPNGRTLQPRASSAGSPPGVPRVILDVLTSVAPSSGRGRFDATPRASVGAATGGQPTTSTRGTVRFSPRNLSARRLDAPPANAGNVEYYHLDGLGSVRVVTDGSGAAIRYHDYEPFGREWHPDGYAPDNPVKDRRLFTAKEWDSETDLDYFGARYYRATVGRFTTTDPACTWKENLVDPQRWNRYAYVRNNPLRYVDPDGRSSVVYDHKTKTLTLYDKDGKEVGSWTAGNNVDSKAALSGGLPDGTYDFEDTGSPHTHDATRDSVNGEFGSVGIFRLKDFSGPDKDKAGNLTTHTGVGVHAGRESDEDGVGRKGPEHATAGCVRTTEEAMKKIRDTAKTDPLTTLQVKNRRTQGKDEEVKK